MPTTCAAREASFGVRGPSPHPTSSARSHGTGMRSSSRRWNWRLWFQGTRALGARAVAELSDVFEEVLRIVVDAVRAGPPRVLAAIASRQHADAQSVGTLGGELIPDAVPDDEAVGDRPAERLGRGEEEIGVGFGVGDLVARDDGHSRVEPEEGERAARSGIAAAGRDRPRHALFGQHVEQVLRAGKGSHLSEPARIGLLVKVAKTIGFRRGQLAPGLAHERAQEQAAAHPDATVDSPDRERDARRLERLLPRQNVLIDAVEQRAVEVEEHRRTVRVDGGRHVRRASRRSHELTVDSLGVTPSIRLGRLFGIEIGFNWSLIFIFALVTWTLATPALPANASGHAALVYWAVAVVGAFLFYVCLRAHELSHSLVARRDGVKVEGITLWLFAGVSRLEGEPATARSEGLIAEI